MSFNLPYQVLLLGLLKNLLRAAIQVSLNFSFRNCNISHCNLRVSTSIPEHLPPQFNFSHFPNVLLYFLAFILYSGNNFVNGNNFDLPFSLFLIPLKVLCQINGILLSLIKFIFKSACFIYYCMHVVINLPFDSLHDRIIILVFTIIKSLR